MSTLVTTNLKNPSNPGNNLVLEANGSVLFSAGTATVPSISFTGDLNTGIYSPGADQVAISTGGSGRLFVDASGRVGVGSAPSVGNGIHATINTNNYGTALVLQNANVNGWAAEMQFLGITTTDTQAKIGALATGPGTNSGALAFYTANAGSYLERLRITSAGLVGVGTSTPASLLTSYAGNVSTLGAKASTGLLIENNGNVGNISQIGLGYTFSSTNHPIVIAAVTTSGAGSTRADLVFATRDLTTDVAPTERMRIDSSGRVGIGATPSTKLHIESNGAGGDVWIKNGTGQNALLEIAGNNNTLGSTSALYGQDASNNVYAGWARGSHPVLFGSNNSEAFRIDTSRRLLVGTSTFSGDGTIVARGSSAGAATQSFLILQRGQTNPAPDLDLGIIRFTDAAGSFGAQIAAQTDGSFAWGANDYPTRLVFSTTADGASSPTERMRIDSAGSLIYGTSTSPGADITSGTGFYYQISTGLFYIRSNGSPVTAFNRGGNDGTLVEFKQDQITEGTISVSGTTVSYNGAHLSRWSQLPSGQERTEILRGSVLSNIDEMCEWGNEENEQLNRMKVSDVEGDKNVSGVFQTWDDDDDIYTNDFYCAMTGDFIIRIGAGVTVERGDLLMSAGDGTAKPQDDDIIRSKTIAKVTSTNVSCTYDDGSYCVPCVLMAC